jgi:tetratricopeptide (TPR) repeat protein
MSSGVSHPETAGGGAPRGARPGASRRFTAVSIAFLTLVSVVPYLNSLRNGFVFDDWNQVVKNPYIRDFHHLRQIFLSGVWSYRTGFEALSNYYRPVMMLGYALCYRLFGPRAFAFHLFSVLLNLAVVLLVYNLTLRMFSRGPLALAAAALFAVHPIHSEAVDWIAAVTELEVAFFFLLTFRFYLAVGQGTLARRALALTGMGASFALALLSKEQAVMLPLLAAVFEHLYRGDRAATSPLRKVLRYGPLWLLAAGYVILRVAALKSFAPVSVRPGFGSVEIVLGALALTGQYLWKFLWPAHLVAFYVFPRSVYTLTSWMLAGCVGLVLSAALFALLWKVARPFSFGVIWFFATLAPVLNAHWMPENVFSERYLYLPSVGFCWIAALGAVSLWEAVRRRSRLGRAALAVAAAVVLAAGMARIFARNPGWKDDLTFYRCTLRDSPGAFTFHNNLGALYWQQGNVAAAERQWKQTLKLSPHYAYALHNMGLVMRRKKHYARAVRYFQQALRSQSDYPDVHLQLGLTYVDMGLLQRAQPELEAAVRMVPADADARNALGELYLEQGRVADALRQFQRAVALRPGVQGYLDLGIARLQNKDYSGAEQAFRRAASLGPQSFRARLILGLFYANRGRKAEAVRELRAALQLDPGNAQAGAALRGLTSPAAKPAHAGRR